MIAHPMTEREAPARLEDQPDTLAMIEKAFGGARDILMNGTTMRYLSDHIEELIAARVAVAWQASRQQALSEAELICAGISNGHRDDWHVTGDESSDWAAIGSFECETSIRSLTSPIGDKA